MQEDLHLFVETVQKIQCKERVLYKGLVLVVLVSVNVISPYGHGPSERNLQYQVVSYHPQKVSGTVSKLMYVHDDLDPMAQQLAGLLIGQVVISHHQ